MRFKDDIRREAREQRRLRAAGEPIPPQLRRYARRAGCGVALICGTGAATVVLLGWLYGPLFWVAALFLAVLAVLGGLQVLTGRHLITGGND